MTEKRFERIYADVDVFCKDHNAKEVSPLIEREDYDKIFDLLNCLNDENEQLKQFKEKVFTWIDKEIARNEEAIEWGKETGADSGSMGFYNHMLKRLKKELSE